MLRWYADVVQTLTGRHLQALRPSEWDWRTVLSTYGSGSHGFNLRRQEIRGKMQPAQWRDLFSAVRRTIVVSSRWNNGPKVAQYAGIISDLDWSRTSGHATIRHKEFLSLGELRQFFGIGEWPEDRHFVSTGRSPEGLISDVFTRLFNDPTRPAGNPWNLPIRIPPAAPGSNDLDFRWWTFTTGREAIAAVTDTMGGPDVRVRPMWDTATGYFYWQLEAKAPKFSDQFAEVHLGSRHPLLDLKFKSDGTKLVTGVFQIGKGSAEDMRLGQGGLGDGDGYLGPADMPYVDTTISDKNESDLFRLRQNAIAERIARAKPIKQWTASVLAAAPVGGGARGVDIGPGWDVHLDDPGDELLDPSNSIQYVIGKSHSSSSKHRINLDWQDA